MSIIIIGLKDNNYLKNQNDEEYDIVYMIDSTFSMETYLKIVKDQCINISNELRNRFKEYNFKFGGVFYKDPVDCENDKNEFIDLTDDIFLLRDYIENIKPSGGGDEAEDWAGGYNLAINKINWGNGLKLIIHICNSNSHGKEYTNSIDNHPNEGEKIPPLLQKCVEKQIKIIGFNIDNGAEISFKKCKKIYDDYDKKRKGLYKYKEFYQNDNFQETFKKAVIEAASVADLVELDGDDEPLINSNGEKWERDKY